MVYGLIIVFNKYQSSEYQERLISEKYPDCKFLYSFEDAISVLRDEDILVVSDVLRLFSLGDFSSFEFDTVFGTVYKNYQTVFSQGADIAVLSCPALDSAIFRKAIMRNLTKGSSATEMAVTEILEAQIKIFLKDLYIKNYRKRENLRKSIKESETNRSRKGIKLVIKKQQPCKDFMLKNLRDFGGDMSNDEVIAKLKISRNTFFKYKKELIATFNTKTDTKIDTTFGTKKKTAPEPVPEPSPAPPEVFDEKPTVSAVQVPDNEKDQGEVKTEAPKKKKKSSDDNQIDGQTSLFDFL